MSSSYFIHSSPISSCTKLWLLISKNKSLQLANPISAIIIIVTPVLIFMLSQVELIFNAKGDKEFPESRYKALELNVPNATSIFYSPTNHVLGGIIQDVADTFERPKPKIESFLYASDMGDALKKKDAFVGIAFEDHFRNIIKMPSKVRIALRFPRHSRSDPRVSWSERLYQLQSASSGINMYETEGFLYLQVKLSELIIKAKNGSAPIPQVHIQSFPDGSTKARIELFAAFSRLALMFFLIFMCPSLVLCMMIVTEKRRYLRDMLQIMGASIGLNWLSWFIVAFVMFMIPTTVVVIMMRVFLCDHSSFAVLMLIFILYILFLICRTFLVCAIFRNPYMAMMVLCILNIVSLVPFFIIFGSKSKSPIIDFFICFCINSSMPYVLIQVLIYEIRGLGVQWNNMFRCGYPEDAMSYGTVLVTMIFGSIICMALCLYLDQLRPGGFRAPRKWYFPFTREFYCPQRNPDDTANEDEQARNSNSLPFEEVTNDKAVIIDSRNLSKAFGPKQAVNNFSLKFYEDEITVLLGHNGAGKTTILMMMAGLYVPTSGRVLINGHDTVVSTQRARKNLCLCPQNLIFFEELSAFWHINFYSRLKGLSPWNAEQEAHTYLYKINLKHMAKTKVRNLSIDMRRKLSLCCALCAGTKVVLCDDPSAYLDPSACRDICDLLLTEKEGRCILLNTYSVNVAAVLADRIGIISDGELIGYGTSDFLLNNLGPGYRLACVPLPDCRVGDVTMFLGAKMNDIRLESVVGSEIVYRLPVTKISEFSTLFRSLERRMNKLKLASFGVSAPTMDETFSKIAADKIDQSYFFNSIAMNEWMQQGMNIQETNKRQRFSNEWHGLLMKKLLYTRHNLIPLTCLIILPLLIAGINILVSVMEAQDRNPYLLYNSFRNYSNPNILRENVFKETENVAEESETVYQPKEIAAEYDRIAMLQGGTLRGIRYSIQDYLLSHLDLNEEGFEKTFVAGATFSSTAVTAWFNRRLTHGQPMSISLVYKAIGNCLADVDIDIINNPRHDSHVTPYRAKVGGNAEKHATMIMIYLSLTMSAFILLPIQERISQMKQQQHLSGISFYNYWLSHLIWDYLMFLLLAISLTLAYFQKSQAMLSWLFVCLMTYAYAALSLNYLFSFIFDGPYIGMTCLIFCNTVTVLVAICTHLHRHHRVYSVIHNIFLIEPFYAMYSAAMATILEGNRLEACEALNLTECPGPCCIRKKIYMVAWKELTFMLISGTIYFSLTLLWTKFCPREINNNRVDCRRASGNDDAKEAGREVDNIVKNEERLKSYSLVCDRVKKTFNGLKAVNCVSIKISPYECLGILGIRGAGKTCLIDLIVGNRKIFQGNIYVKGFSMKNLKQRQKCFSHMGYCPQHHMVLHYMTGREMLKFACLIRGIKKQYLPRIIESLAESFVFGKYLDQLTVHYSNSTKRKLNIAIAVLSPTLICLDDPITDVDICAKQEISRVLRQMLSHGKSLLITSHSVYDCEILCSSLAIMVNGKLRCIGTAEDLRTRFNRGISVKIQVGTTEEMDEIRMALIDLSSGPSPRTSEIKNTDAKEQQDQEPQSPNEKAVQVNIKKKKKSSKIESANSGESSKSSKQEEKQSIGRGTLVRKKRKTSVSTRRTTIGMSHTGSSLLNVYITNNDESNFFSLLMDVEKRFKIDYPRSYVTDTFSNRGLITIIIPDKDLKWSEIFKYMEDNRFRLQIKHYAISQTTLEDIFLNIVQD